MKPASQNLFMTSETHNSSFKVQFESHKYDVHHQHPKRIL